MNSTELKSELHRIIENIDDDSILHAVHTLLERTTDAVFSTDGIRLGKKEIDRMMREGEEDISTGRVTGQQQLIEEIKSWRRK